MKPVATTASRLRRGARNETLLPEVQTDRQARHAQAGKQGWSQQARGQILLHEDGEHRFLKKGREMNKGVCIVGSSVLAPALLLGMLWGFTIIGSFFDWFLFPARQFVIDRFGPEWLAIILVVTSAWWLVIIWRRLHNHCRRFWGESRDPTVPKLPSN